MLLYWGGVFASNVLNRSLLIAELNDLRYNQNYFTTCLTFLHYFL